MRFDRATLGEIISMVFTCEDGDVVISHSASEAKGRYWLCTENVHARRTTEATLVDAAARRAAQIASLLAMGPVA